MIIAFSGPSGIGKGYAKEAILNLDPEIKEIVWYTTRELRPGEKNRKSLTEAEFDLLERAGKLALVQKIFGHRYAVEKSALLDSEDIFLTEIHPHVVAEAKSINSNLVLIGMVTNDTELLRERLSLRRKTESPSEIDCRVRAAMEEISEIRDQSELFTATICVNRDNETKIAPTVQTLFATLMKKEAK